ncbi:general transcription factor IIE subunit 2-like [Limulus polyphemus]|uniref:Transcription initiation factor IIE subunit beta n=1 Tax=Limulus polyphemus TaxID=6850 RepID=A0ABM1BE51_LIMPO|nr:general transcription factor IIE subunit 2-like [Limulus polyphemus]XP_022247995.1 general transcription factor IIE subunit 2-like [Limulus polyphemus]
MDPALLKEREAFKKRAIATPVVENKKREVPSSGSQPPSKKKSKQSSSSKPKIDANTYKTASGTSQYNFSVLAKIVKHMKQRHLDGDTEPLTVEELLDETNQLGIGSRQRHWLTTEALVNNPKIQTTPDGRYVFKPVYNIKDRKSLLRLLDKHDQRGIGGILLEDIQESLPNADKIIKNLGDSVIFVIRPNDKKKILFYNDKSLQFTVDEEFQKLWRSVAVDGIDEQKIEDYLQKQGITSMQDIGVKKLNPIQKRKRPNSKKPRNFKKHNEHMGDILQEYTDT